MFFFSLFFFSFKAWDSSNLSVHLEWESQGMEQGLGHRSAYRGQQLGVVVSGHHSRKEQVLL